MHTFDDKRAEPLIAGPLKTFRNKKVRLKTAKRGYINISRKAVRLILSRRLEESDGCVVDYGPLAEGEKPTAAIIAAAFPRLLPQL